MDVRLRAAIIRFIYVDVNGSFDRTGDFRPGGIIIPGWGGVAEHRGRGRRLPEERICTWQRTERQLPEKVSRVAGHPSISSPFDSLRVALIFVSFHSALSPLPLRSAKLKEPRVRTCLEKFSRNQPRSENSSLGFGFRKWTSRL